MLHEILRRIVDHTVPARLPKPWAFLSPVPSIRVLDSEPSALVASLLAEFPEDELLNAQILLRDPDGARRLAPAVDAKAPFKVVTPQVDGMPCDFEHEQGRLTAGEPAALRCLDDHLTREQSAKHQWVLATFSNLDQAVLSMLDLPATPASGLRDMTADQARRFLTPPPKTIHGPQLSDGSSQLSEERPRIILAATELFALRNQMPAGSLHAATQFQRVERTMKLDTATHIGIWLPSPADFRLIRDCVALADRQLVFKAITDSVRSCESIKQYFESTSAPVADDAPRMRRKLQKVISTLKTSTFGTHELPPLLEALNRAVDNDIIERAYDEAMVATNSLDKSLWTEAAELMEIQFESSNIVQRTRAAIATGCAENGETSLEDRLRFQVRLGDALIRIKKALEMNK
jgi:hypothetical protein